MMLDQELGFIYPILPVYKHSSPIYDPCGSVTVSFASRVAAQKLARLGGGRRKWLLPCQVLQHRMARFCAQPGGPGLVFRDNSVFRTQFGKTNLVSPALPLPQNS